MASPNGAVGRPRDVRMAATTANPATIREPERIARHVGHAKRTVVPISRQVIRFATIAGYVGVA